MVFFVLFSDTATGQ